MRLLTPTEVHAQKIRELGLDPTALDLTTVEGISGALRRAASFLCPCSAPTLVRGVLKPLRGLVPDFDAFKELVEDTLEAIIAHGDVLEQRECSNDSSRGTVLLYAAPPGFVARKSGLVILLGVGTDQLLPLPDELVSRVQYAGHVRRLQPESGEHLQQDLKQLGFIELSYEAWLKCPKPESPAGHIAIKDRALSAADPSRDIPGLVLIDPERPVRYYRGRWVEPKSRTGRYVARRSQAYGADLWCYVHINGGFPERMIDLPLKKSRWRGCDEAWHLQLAIDAKRGDPQCFRVRKGPGNTAILELFSPVPAWARRRWDAVGTPLPSSGCLFAYLLDGNEIEEELHFAREALWLEKLSERNLNR